VTILPPSLSRLSRQIADHKLCEAIQRLDKPITTYKCCYGWSGTLYNLFIKDTPQTSGVNLALFADDTCLYATERKEGKVLRKIQRALNSMTAWCERWNIKINEEKARAICFTHRNRPSDSPLTLNGRNTPFVNSVKYLGVIFDKRMTWRLHIEIIEAKAFRTFIRIYSLLKSERLSANIKLTLYKALIRSVMTYACPAREFAAESHLLKLQRLKAGFSIPLAAFRGAHRFAICMRLSKFRTFMIT
jgi:hypothetical protein